MDYFNLEGKRLLRTGGMCSDLQLKSRDLHFEPVSFIRTGDTSIEVLFKTVMGLLTPDVLDNTSDTMPVSERIYNNVKELFSNSDKGNFKGLVGFEDCESNPDFMVQHNMDNSTSTYLAMPSTPHKRYTLIAIESYVIFKLNFDNSSRINKMIITQSDKYLGRYLLCNEERTDILLQDKEA